MAYSKYDDCLDTLHVENVELDDVRLQPHYKRMDISLTVTYEEEPCECTSEMGNQTVTERWMQYNIYDWSINSITLRYDYINVPTHVLTEADLKVIRELIPDYEP